MKIGSLGWSEIEGADAAVFEEFGNPSCS